MATLSWHRQIILAQQWTSALQTVNLVKLNSGQSIVRNHIAWGFSGTTGTAIIPTAVMGNVAALGLVTTIGNGTESVPDPLISPGNANPPSQRWLYFSVRAPVAKTWDSAAGVISWTSSRPEEEGSSEGQVLAPSGMGTGNTLNLWMAWDTVATWDPSGAAVLWCAVSTLVRSP